MIEVNKIICGDNIEVMKQIDAESIDMVLTSPPYDNLRDYEGFKFDFENTAKELLRVLKQGGVIVWVVGDATINGSETGTSFKQALYFKELGLNLHDTMIYSKTGISFPSANRYHQIFEYMFVLSKETPKTFNPIMRKNIYGGDFRKNWVEREKGGKMGRRKGKKEVKDEGYDFNIWQITNGLNKTTNDKYAFEHPAMFPEKLAADHIISWSNKGDLILDPFNGSGTTTKMAQALGRNFIGIDISQKYCSIANERLRQKPLF